MEWFRYYQDDLDDDVLQQLPSDVFKFYANLKCLANRGNGVLPPLRTIVFRCRLAEQTAQQYLEVLLSSELLTQLPEGVLEVSRWQKEQRVSDCSAPRVRRYREQQRQEALECGNRTVTLPHRYSNGLDRDRETEEEEKNTCATDVACVPETEPQKVPQKPKTELRLQQESWFSEFWADYWRKKDKEPAWAAFRKLITSEEVFRQLREALTRDREEMLRRPVDKRPYGATYLHKKPWLDGAEAEPRQRTENSATNFPREIYGEAQPIKRTAEEIEILREQAQDECPTIRQAALTILAEYQIPEVSSWKN
jgi:hypothetical protein